MAATMTKPVRPSSPEIPLARLEPANPGYTFGLVDIAPMLVPVKVGHFSHALLRNSCIADRAGSSIKPD
jgi:hypothetical protein